MKNLAVRSAATLLVLTALGLPAQALLNPNFTPKHVEAQSKLLCAVRVDSIAPDNKQFTLLVLDIIKGKADAPRYTVDLAALQGPDNKDKLDLFLDLLKSAGTNAALLATGDIMNGKAGALMHMDGTWCKMETAQDGKTLKFLQVDSSLNSTFNGSTDMLIGTMRFIVKFPDAPVMPVSAGIEWTEHQKVGTLKGRAAAILPVDANADGKPDFLAAAPTGDLLFLNTGTSFEPCPGLTASSAAAAWGDFDGDGRPDLASLSAAGLTIHLQKEPGKFSPGEIKLPGKIQTESPTLWAVDLGNGKASLVAGIGVPVVLLNKEGKGTFETVPLAAPETKADAGIPGPCLAADFDGDGIVDVIQTAQTTGMLWRGKGGGGFAAPAACGALMGPAKRRQASVADCDGDGLLDILLIGGDRTPILLQNRGGRFEDRMRQTGEPGYIIQSGAGCAALADFNNDTFVDFFVGYNEEPCQFFFNRGFRSFAIAEPLKFKDDDMPGADNGQAAGAWIDLDGNGTLELVSALVGGDIHVSRSTLGQMEDPQRIVVKLGPGPQSAAVTFHLQGRCLGTRVADRWAGPAVLGITEPGRYLVNWNTPDGKEGSMSVDADQPLIQITIGASAGVPGK